MWAFPQVCLGVLLGCCTACLGLLGRWPRRVEAAPGLSKGPHLTHLSGAGTVRRRWLHPEGDARLMRAVLKSRPGERGYGAAPGAWERAAARGSGPGVFGVVGCCHSSLRLGVWAGRGTLMRLLKMEKTSPMADWGFSIIHVMFTCTLFASVICGKICESSSVGNNQNGAAS